MRSGFAIILRLQLHCLIIHFGLSLVVPIHGHIPPHFQRLQETHCCYITCSLLIESVTYTCMVPINLLTDCPRAVFALFCPDPAARSSTGYGTQYRRRFKSLRMFVFLHFQRLEVKRIVRPYHMIPFEKAPWPR